MLSLRCSDCELRIVNWRPYGSDGLDTVFVIWFLTESTNCVWWDSDQVKLAAAPEGAEQERSANHVVKSLLQHLEYESLLARI